MVETLAQQGKIAAASVATLARSGVALGVPAGRPKPDVSSVKALKGSLLAETSIAYPDPSLGHASGIHFRGVLLEHCERFGVDDRSHVGLQPHRIASGRGDDVEVGVRAHGVTSRREQQELSVRGPARKEIVPGAIGDRALRPGRHIEDADRERLARGVRRVRDLRPVRRPGDVAVHHLGLLREIALVLAVAVDDPDRELLVSAGIAHEGDPLPVR